MISSDLTNTLFISFAKFVSQLTGREVNFEQLKYGEGMPGAALKINNFLKEATEAFDNPIVNIIGALDPGKVYCLQVDTVSHSSCWDWIEAISKGLSERDISLVVVDKDMNFISIPEDYEVIKRNDEN